VPQADDRPPQSLAAPPVTADESVSPQAGEPLAQLQAQLALLLEEPLSVSLLLQEEV
jgi:hypothetical protein